MSEFAKKFDKLELKIGVVEGKIVDVDGIKALAALPSKEGSSSRGLSEASTLLYPALSMSSMPISEDWSWRSMQ